METVPSNTQSGSMSPPVEHDSPQIIPESLSSPHTVIDKFLGVVSPLPMLPPEMSEDHTISEPEEEKDGQSNNNISEDEQKEETSFRQEEEEDENYEEVVLKPRPLNEVTSLTDRTSPWTSVLSDPELVSVESTEAPRDSDLSEAEDEKRLRAQSSDGSDGEPSDTERNDERTRQEAELNPNSPDRSSGDSDSSATPPPDPDPRDVSGPQDNEELQTYP